MSKSYPSFDDVMKAREQLTELSYQHWLHDDFLSWKWWLQLALSVIPWFIWWKISDKKRIHEILLYGLLTGIMAITLDNIGTDLIWWSYPDKLFQMIPPMFPADYTLVPCSLMVVYQLTATWRTFLFANVILAAFNTLVGETLFIKLGFYRLHSWHLSYSFLFYIAAAMLARWIIENTRPKALAK
ncbi:CBO0543 family protein [Paenibacillus hamazuiensis]|uniref:CBO0543 family protein n=1 Tax=Paenibacillus hamazuiensis TaxID=2936508 RepID=UPI00200E518A|nr:CBO0543 family protein [Paenibacillus hamazuiensis]